MRTLTARALRTLVVSAALAFAAPAVAIETLVNTAERAMPSVSVAPTEKAHTAILNDVSAFPHYTGAVNASAAIRNRGFSLTLPDTGETVTIENLEVAEIEGGYTLTTSVHADGPVLELVVMGTVVTGTLRIGHEDLYVITPLGDGRAVVHRQHPEEGAPAYPHDHEHREHYRFEPEVNARSAATAQAPSPKAAPGPAASTPVIDVLFVYNDQAAVQSGGIAARAALTVLKVNQTFARSAIATRIRSAGLHRTEYESNGRATDSTHSGRLRGSEDGYMDEVHAARTLAGADVVSLLLGTVGPQSCGGGIAYVLRYHNVHFEQARQSLIHDAFTVTGVGRAHCVDHDAHAHAHELAHLHAALHNPEEFNPDQIEAIARRYYPYGFGYCNATTGWRTVVAYNTDNRCSRRTYHFSNPDISFEGVPTGTAERHDVARLIDENAVHVAAFLEPPAPTVHTRHLPFLPQANGGALLGFVRLHNRTEEDAEIEIYGYDESGERFGPITTTLPPGRARGLNAHHLEGLIDHAALDSVLGDGEGHWRLMLRSDTPIEARAYVRTHAGFASPMHLRAALIRDSVPRAYHVPFLNPGSNLGSRGYLRITNPSWEENTVTLRAWDDSAAPAENAVTLTIAPRATVTLSAQDLERGNPDRFEGRFGDGAGKWRVRAESADQRALFVLGLVATRDGALHNVSR